MTSLPIRQGAPAARRATGITAGPITPWTVLRLIGSGVGKVGKHDGFYAVLLVLGLAYALHWLAIPLALGAIGVAGWQAWVRFQAAEKGKGWLSSWRCLLIVAILCNLLLPLIALDRTTIAALLSLVALEVLLHRPTPPEARRAWWTHARLAGAMLAAGILPKPAADDPNPLPTLGYVGKPKVDERGAEVTVRLPPGKTYADVEAKSRPLASALGVAERRLVISYDPSQPANCVTLYVSASAGAVLPDETSPLVTAERTSFYDPVPIGRTVRSEPVTIDLYEHNSMWGGRPGYGKTTAVRAPLAGTLLDPVAYVYGGDGKGSRADYAGVARLAEAWVWGTDDDPATDLLEKVLRPVLAIVRARNACEHEPEGGWPGVLLMLEEFQEFRAAAEPDVLKEIDATHKRIIRMGRAVGVHDAISTQRPTVDDVPSAVRNLVDTNVCLPVRSSDVGIVLGSAATIPLPTDKGQAILGTPQGQTGVYIYNITREDMAGICERAAKARALVKRPDPLEQAQRLAGVSTVPAETDDGGACETFPGEGDSAACTAPSEPVLPPLWAALAGILSEHPQGITSTEVLPLLPAAVAPTGSDASRVVKIGKVLKAMADEGLTRKAPRGKSPAWWPVAALAAPAAAPAEQGATVISLGKRLHVVTPRSGTLYGDEHAHEGAEHGASLAPTMTAGSMP